MAIKEIYKFATGRRAEHKQNCIRSVRRYRRRRRRWYIENETFVFWASRSMNLLEWMEMKYFIFILRRKLAFSALHSLLDVIMRFVCRIPYCSYGQMCIQTHKNHFPFVECDRSSLTISPKIRYSCDSLFVTNLRMKSKSLISPAFVPVLYETRFCGMLRRQLIESIRQ